MIDINIITQNFTVLTFYIYIAYTYIGVNKGYFLNIRRHLFYAKNIWKRRIVKLKMILLLWKQHFEMPGLFNVLPFSLLSSVLINIFWHSKTGHSSNLIWLKIATGQFWTKKCAKVPKIWCSEPSISYT